MADVYLECRPILVGDSLWHSSAIVNYQANGDNVTVVCDQRNKGVYEFIRDYVDGADKLNIITSYNGQTVINGGGPGGPTFNGEDCVLKLRREPEPIVKHEHYICFQPESASHGKRRNSLRKLYCKGIGYSLGVLGEYVQPGTESFHSKSISDVARLIYHSDGVVAVMSSMALLACMLNKKVICLGYEGINVGPINPIGHPAPRCRFVEGSPEEIERAVREHIGTYL